MADVGKPITRGPGLTPSQPAVGKKPATVGRKGASKSNDLAQTPGGASSRQEADSFEGQHDAQGSEHGHTAMVPAPAPLGPRAALPERPGAKNFVQNKPLPGAHRPVRAMASVGPLNTQSLQEHVPSAVNAAIAQLSPLRGTATADNKALLNDMGKLLQQALFKKGFSPEEAKLYTTLAEKAGLSANPKVMAAASYVRPVTPGTSQQVNPFSVLQGIHEEQAEEHQAVAQGARLTEAEAKLHAMELENITRAKENAKKNETTEKKEAGHEDERNTKIDNTRAQLRRQPKSALSAQAQIAEAQKAQDANFAAARGHTVKQAELSAQQLPDRARDDDSEQ